MFSESLPVDNDTHLIIFLKLFYIILFQNSFDPLENIFESGDYSPPMPTQPPPPPPPIIDEDLVNPSSDSWLTNFDPVPAASVDLDVETIEEPYGIALYDFPGTHNDDLPFKVFIELP